ncbi:MAG: hypothetical protein AAB740_03260 [Patescibacteria group bacterium]
MYRKKPQKITNQDLQFIYGKDYPLFAEKILPNCFCGVCYKKMGEPTTIANYQISIDDLNNVILQGFCGECGFRVGRYVEIGEIKEYLPRITQIRSKNKK